MFTPSQYRLPCHCCPTHLLGQATICFCNTYDHFLGQRCEFSKKLFASGDKPHEMQLKSASIALTALLGTAHSRRWARFLFLQNDNVRHSITPSRSAKETQQTLKYSAKISLFAQFVRVNNSTKPPLMQQLLLARIAIRSASSSSSKRRRRRTPIDPDTKTIGQLRSTSAQPAHPRSRAGSTYKYNYHHVQAAPFFTNIDIDNIRRGSRGSMLMYTGNKVETVLVIYSAKR